MPKRSRQSVKTLTLVKSRDIVVDRLIKPCEEGDHSKCTGWAVLRKEISPIDVNYFLKCTCACHKKEQKQIRMKQLKKRVKKRTKKKQKGRKTSKSSKRSKRTKRR
jgi:mannitol-specific phosphotransferase system IIBC component